eukprot:jgi/Botrbrau1/3872/Bobra.0183s0096.1
MSLPPVRKKQDCFDLACDRTGQQEQRVMEPAASSSDMTADVGPLREIPHALFRHIFPGLPLPTILQLSRSSRDCRHATRAAIPKKLDQLVASVSSGCSYYTWGQLVLLLQFLERFRGADPVLREDPRMDDFIVAPDGTIIPVPLHMLVQFPDVRAPFIHVRVYGFGGRNNEERKVALMIRLYTGMNESLFIDFTYQTNASGRMAGRKILMWVESFEGVDVGQAVLLFFQRAWQADDLEFWAPMKSPGPCIAIILASRSAVWESYDPKRLTWETGQEGPRLRLVGL